MPRQIDLFPQNLQVNNDPTNRMGVTAAQINHLQDQIPAAQAKAQEVAINAMLTALDSVTGLDLVGWWKDTQDLLNLINASQQQSWLNFQNFLNGLTQQTDADVAGALEWIQTQFNQLSASLQQSWLSFQNLINSVVGGVDKDVNDLIVALNSTGADAATATANWDTLFLDLGFSVTTAAQLASWLGGTNTTATNGSSWSTKITNDLAILFDVFHVTYQAGSTGDAPGTLGTNGKPTWYSAWNDILALLGVVNSTSTPSIPAPTIGSAITTAQSTATSAQTTLNTTNTNLFGSTTPGTAIQTAAVPSGIPATKIANVLGGSNLGADVSSVSTTASNGTSWSTRLTNDLLITSDVFHTVYQAGSPTDTPTTLGTNGKRTWYSAWNDILALAGVVNSTTAPTDAAPTVGTAINNAQSTANTAQSTATTNSSTLTTLNTNLFNQSTPGLAIQTSALPTITVSGITDSIQGQVQSVTSITNRLPQGNILPSTAVSGQSVALVASGAGGTTTGTGTLEATWTDTIPSTANYFMIAGNTATTHGGVAEARIIVGGANYTLSPIATVSYASSGRVTLFGLANPPVGAVTCFAGATDASSLFSMVSGTSMAFSNVSSVSPAVTNQALNSDASLTTAFTSSQYVVNAIGSFGTANANVGLSSYNQTSRYHAGNFNGGSQFNMDLVAGTASAVSSPSFTAAVSSHTNSGCAEAAVAFNAPPTIMGSFARVYRSATSAASFGSSTDTTFGSLFDTTQEASSDITVDLTTSKFTVAYSGTYLLKVGVKFQAIFSTQAVDALCYVNNQLFERSAQFWYASSSQSRLSWSTPVYLNAGDYVQPGLTWATTGAVGYVGESTGTQCYMSLSLLNRSLL